MSKKIKKEKVIKLPTHFEIYESIRKAPVPPVQEYKQKKGKGSYTRTKKYKKKEEE